MARSETWNKRKFWCHKERLREKYKEGESSIKCVYCIYYQDLGERATCSLCLRQAYKACLEQKNNEEV